MCKIREASTCHFFAVVFILSARLASVQFAEGSRAGQSGGVELFFLHSRLLRMIIWFYLPQATRILYISQKLASSGCTGGVCVSLHLQFSSDWTQHSPDADSSHELKYISAPASSQQTEPNYSTSWQVKLKINLLFNSTSLKDKLWAAERLWIRAESDDSGCLFLQKPPVCQHLFLQPTLLNADFQNYEWSFEVQTVRCSLSSWCILQTPPTWGQAIVW